MNLSLGCALGNLTMPLPVKTVQENIINSGIKEKKKNQCTSG